jgi:DNA primase
MAGYSPAVLDQVRAGIDIVELVGRVVNLRKAGVNWKGLCPFHAEKTPSFTVNPHKGIFHCFGCGVGGDAFGFVMRQDKLAFPEAVRALAKLAGVTLPEERDPGQADSGRETLYRVMDLAARFYADALWAPGGERAQRYLAERGIDPEVARRFGMGYAPDAWDALHTRMRGEGVSDDTLIAAGLVVQREQRAGVYDRFRGRLLFAIRDLQGRVVAFGGRALGDEQPKYLNSPETPLYTKGQLLYGADVAREPIRAKNRALIVEGYIDCLMAHQHGFGECVAALGTSFTTTQLHLLRRYTNEAVIFFDGDVAGQKAAERAEALLDSMGTDAFWDPTSGGGTWAINRTGAFKTTESLRVKVAILPGGHDPDTFLRAEGAEAFEARIAQARSLVAYALESTLATEVSTGPRARANVLARAALTLAKVGDAEEAASVSREIAFKLGLDPVHLLDEARRLQAALRRPVPSAPSGRRTAPTVPERDLALLLLREPDARTALLPLLGTDDLEHAGLRTIVAAMHARPEASAETLMPDLPDDETRALLAALLVEEQRPANPGESIEQFRRRLALKRGLRRMRAVTRGIAEAQAGGAGAMPQDEFRAVHQDGAVVYQLAGGVAQSLEERGEAAPKGVQTDE